MSCWSTLFASIRGDVSIKSRAVYAIARGRLALNRCEIAILPVPDLKPDAGLTDFEPGVCEFTRNVAPGRPHGDHREKQW